MRWQELFVIWFAGTPTSLAGVRFLGFLSHDEWAFDELFCVAFRLMDAHWLAKRASYMEFNVSNQIIKFWVNYNFMIYMNLWKWSLDFNNYSYRPYCLHFCFEMVHGH